jgi:hypothetical protein
MYLDRSYAKPIRVTNKPLLRHIPHGMAQSCERVPSNTSYHNSAKLFLEDRSRGMSCVLLTPSCEQRKMEARKIHGSNANALFS